MSASAPVKFVPSQENIALMVTGGILILISGGMIFGGFNIQSSYTVDPTKSITYDPDNPDPLATGCNGAQVGTGKTCWDSIKQICWIIPNDPSVVASDCVSQVPKSKWITMWCFAGLIGFIGFILLMVGVGKGSTAAKDLLPSSPAKNKSD